MDEPSIVIVFKAEQRIRVEVANANLPGFDRDPQTGETSTGASQLEQELQRVFHDKARPSHIELPIIP
jgi:predicted acyl esterase